MNSAFCMSQKTCSASLSGAENKPMASCAIEIVSVRLSIFQQDACKVVLLSIGKTRGHIELRFPLCDGRRFREVSQAPETTTAVFCAHNHTCNREAAFEYSLKQSRSAFQTQSSSLPSEEFEKFEKFMFEKLKFEKLNSESDMFFRKLSYHSLEKFEFLNMSS